MRACDDIQGNDVIGRSGKGYSTRIAFDLDDPMGSSSCVTCGECVAACPTGALTNKPINDVPIRPRSELDAVDSVCPYCGVGCALTFYVDRERGAIAFAEGRDQPGSQGRLCVKGRYGWDYAASPQRLTVPLIRVDAAYPKGPLSGDVRGDDDGDRQDGRSGRRRKPGGLVPYDEVLPHFREASWDEALDLVAAGSAASSPSTATGRSPASARRSAPTRRRTCSRSWCAPASATTTSTTAPGCATPPASPRCSRASGPARCRRRTATCSTPTSRSSPAATPPPTTRWRRRSSSRHGVAARRSSTSTRGPARSPTTPTSSCQIKPGTDVAFYNSLMHEIIRLDLVDRDFVDDRTSNFDALAATVADYPPERAEQITGISADVIRQVARVWGEASAGIIFWGMGISQHTTGTDNARCLIALCSITGNVGKPGTGLHPLRGQNNVQGASDAGLIPMFLPDYQAVDGDDAAGPVRDGMGHRRSTRSAA